jgi:hypothetical protein
MGNIRVWKVPQAGLLHVETELLHCNINYGGAARAKYGQNG